MSFVILLKKSLQLFVWAETGNQPEHVAERKMQLFFVRNEGFIFRINSKEGVDGFSSEGVQCVWLEEEAKHQHKQMLKTSYLTEDF